MRATVQSSDLAAALKLSVASSRSNMTLLQNALLVAQDGLLSLETTDCEISVRSSIPAEIDQPGSMLMHEALLRPVASGSGAIRLNADGAVSRGRSHYRIPVLANVNDFPKPDPADFRKVDIDAAQLRSAMRAVAYNGDDDLPANQFKALFVVPGAVWCSDGRQIGRVAIDYDGPVMALPIAQVQRTIAALQDGADVLVGNERAGQAGQLRIESRHTALTLRLLATSPIEIKRLLIDSLKLSDQHVVLKRGPLVAALRRFMPFAQWGGHKSYANFSVTLEAAKDELILADRADDNRESLADALDEMHGSFRFACNPKRLLEALNAIDTDQLRLYPPTGQRSPDNLVVLLPDKAEVDTVVHLLAPLQN